MAVARALCRLLSVLELEEEQAHVALERSLGALRRLEEARSSAIDRERRGRRLVAGSAGNGDIVDRLAGLEEARTARRLAAVLRTRIAEAEREVAERREAFLAKRVERRQAATLIEQVQAAEAVQAGRRDQQRIDEWFLGRMRREEKAEPVEPLHPSAPGASVHGVGEAEAGGGKS